MNDRIANVATVVLVLCAIAITGLVVRRELFSRVPAASAPREVKEWRQLARDGVFMGPADAPVRIVEFSDFQCPFCAQVQGSLRELRRRYPGQVVVVYRHFPLESIHPHARTAAQAAACADGQGRFEAYHDALFQYQDSIGVAAWDRFARIAKLPDVDSFRDCVASGRYSALVQRDVDAAVDLGVRVTPTLIVNGKLVGGAATLGELDRMVREALPAR